VAVFNAAAVSADFFVGADVPVWPATDIPPIPFTVSADVVVWPAAEARVGPLAGSSILTNQIASVAPPELPAPFDGSIVVVMDGRTGRTEYADGFRDGESYGFSSPREHVMEPILLGETDDDRKTVSFHIYTSAGYPADGLAWQQPVCVPIAGQVMTNRDLAGYVNSTGAFSHVGDGTYRYTFATSEVAAGSEGNIWLRVLVPGFRTVVLRVPLRNVEPTANELRDAVLDAARSGHLTTGTVGEGLAIATSLLQGNTYMDQVVNAFNGQISARLRCFLTGAAAQAATAGGSGQGEFATFIVTTVYEGPNRVATHRVVQQ
jgi:hypothetical protein